MTRDEARERIIDARVQLRLARDTAYRDSETAEEQAEREREIEREVEWDFLRESLVRACDEYRSVLNTPLAVREAALRRVQKAHGDLDEFLGEERL